jgi:hypothetical protein
MLRTKRPRVSTWLRELRRGWQASHTEVRLDRPYVIAAQNERRLVPFLLKSDLSYVSDRRLLRVQFQGTFAYNISVDRAPDLRRAKSEVKICCFLPSSARSTLEHSSFCFKRFVRVSPDIVAYGFCRCHTAASRYLSSGP